MDNIADLIHAVEGQHGGVARFRESVPVRETFEGQTVWDGVVHVFDLAGHPTASRRLRLVLADRGQHEAAILRCASPIASGQPASCGARRDRGRTQEGIMGRKTYLGGSTVLRFSPKAKNAWLETGPNAAEGAANVERAERKRAANKQQVIDDMNKRERQRLAKRRAERPVRPSSN